MRSTFSLFIVICLGHVLLISAQVQSKSGLPVLQSVAFGSFARAQQLTTGVADTGRSIWTNYFALRGAARENAALRQRILDLEVQLQEQQARGSRAQTLENALGLKESLVARTLVANVIAGNPQPGSLTVMIDRGTDNGVELGMAVIGERGVVGRIIAPLARDAANVQLIVGRSAAAAVTFERSNTGGMVMGGYGDPPLRAAYVSSLATVQPGERVLTSGQDGIYPRGFPIGVVESAERNSSGAREITVRPAVDFSHIDVVLVVLDRPARTAPSGK